MPITGFPDIAIINSSSAGRSLLRAADSAAQRVLLQLSPSDMPTFNGVNLIKTVPNQYALNILGSLVGADSTSLVSIDGSWNTTSTTSLLKIDLNNVQSGSGSSILRVDVETTLTPSTTVFDLSPSGKLYLETIQAFGIPSGSTETDVLVIDNTGEFKTISRSSLANYGGDSPTTISVGGLPAGSDIDGLPLSDVLESILVPYISPSFTSFAIGQSTPVEVGVILNNNQSFSFSFSNIGNVQSNSLQILDVTAGNLVLGTFPISPSPVSVAIGTGITFTSPGSYSWRGRATNTQATLFTSVVSTVNWYWRLYYGTSVNQILAEADIESLVNNLLTGTIIRTYSFAGGGYKYFCWADSLGSPTIFTGFKDTQTNLSVSMADSSDNAAYSNVQNGWSYALVSVTNAQGIATNYRVYRTKNILGSSINIQVS